MTSDTDDSLPNQLRCSSAVALGRRVKLTFRKKSSGKDSRVLSVECRLTGAGSVAARSRARVNYWRGMRADEVMDDIAYINALTKAQVAGDILYDVLQPYGDFDTPRGEASWARLRGWAESAVGLKMLRAALKCARAGDEPGAARCVRQAAKLENWIPLAR